MQIYYLRNERRRYPVLENDFAFLTMFEVTRWDRVTKYYIATKISPTEAMLDSEWKALETETQLDWRSPIFEPTLTLYTYNEIITLFKKPEIHMRIDFQGRHIEFATCALCYCDHDIKLCNQIQSKLICLECQREISYAKATANVADYIARKRLATPKWADLDAIEAVYTEARIRTLKTGIQHHVDHFYPLRSRKVQGLHVAGNLQILTAQDNLKKSNKLV
jgi:hypothetical protein